MNVTNIIKQHTNFTSTFVDKNGDLKILKKKAQSTASKMTENGFWGFKLHEMSSSIKSLHIVAQPFLVDDLQIQI